MARKRYRTSCADCENKTKDQSSNPAQGRPKHSRGEEIWKKVSVRKKVRKQKTFQEKTFRVAEETKTEEEIEQEKRNILMP